MERLKRASAENGLSGPSSSSNPLAKWLKFVSPTQQLLATRNKLAMAQAAKKGQPVQQNNPVGCPP
eukprot:1139466-Pelagomonas_calceolata.AAC.1